MYFCSTEMNQLNNTAMEAKNVKNGIICSIARIEKETEKALQLTFSVVLYGADFVIRKQWMPKSMINEVCREDDRIFFTPKNDWILDKKTREYCAYVAETFDNVRNEIKTYLSRINTEVIKRVSA